jgi:hypothetical protein
MKEAIERRAQMSAERRDRVRLGWYFTHWPDLVQSFRQIHKDLDPISKQARIATLAYKTKNLDDDVKRFGKSILDKAYELGHIIEEVDDSPFGAKARFNSLEAMPYQMEYTVLLIIINRIRYYLQEIQGENTKDLCSEYKSLCHRIWLSLPAIRNQGPVAMALAQGPLYLSYEGTTSDAEKDYLLDYFVQSKTLQGQSPASRLVMERHVINTARVMCGQPPLCTTSFNQQ